MIQIILATCLMLSGTASQYADGVMERVISYRQKNPTAYSLPLKIPSVDGYLATRDCYHIGKTVYVIHENKVERFLVVDCSSTTDGTISWMNRNNIVAEVDYETAVRWRVLGRGTEVTILIPQYERIMQ